MSDQLNTIINGTGSAAVGAHDQYNSVGRVKGIKSLLVVLCAGLFQGVLAQTQVDSARVRFSQSAFRFSLTEMVPFLYDRYGKNAEYARISFSSAAHNLNPGNWAWDTDAFPTNQIGHPFHGSQFFNAFRAGGYSFWQSVPATFAGSYLWETFGENEPPSINDFINTSIGGIMLGELTHRLAERVHQSRRRGWLKETAKIAALLINPADAMYRIENGIWNKIPGKPEEQSPIKAEADIGLRKFSPNHANPFMDGKFGLYGRLRITYGDPFENKKMPFSHITLLAELGQDDSSNLNILSLRAQVAAWNIGRRERQHLLFISADYDYLNNEVFFYSGESIKANIFSNWCNTRRLAFSTSFGMGPLLLAAIPNDYNYKTRDYDYGPGFAFYGAAKMVIARLLTISSRYNGGWMFTSNGSDSRYYLHMITTEASIFINKQVSLCAESGHFTLYSRYAQLGDERKIYPYLRVSLRVFPF